MTKEEARNQLSVALENWKHVGGSVDDVVSAIEAIIKPSAFKVHEAPEEPGAPEAPDVVEIDAADHPLVEADLAADEAKFEATDTEAPNPKE